MNKIFWRNRIYFYLSFFSAGTQSLITQLFVNTHYPEVKEWLLPLVLLCGALALILGTIVGGKNLSAPPLVVKLMLAVHLAAFCGLLFATALSGYLLLYIICCFTCNFLYNYLDHFFLSRVGRVASHVKTMLFYQLLAFILAPLYFSLIAGKGGWRVIPVILLAVACSIPVFRLCESAGSPSRQADRKTEPVRMAGEKVFLGYTLGFMTIVSLALSLFTYFVLDYYALPGAVLKSGLCLAGMSLAACLVIILWPRSGGSRGQFFIRIQLGIVFAYLGLSVLLGARLSRSFVYLASISLLLGAGYGLFLVTTRQMAAGIFLGGRNPRLLTGFNNLQGLAYLLAYGIVALLGWKQKYLEGNYYQGALGIVFFLLACELILLLMLTSRLRHPRGNHERI